MAKDDNNVDDLEVKEVVGFDNSKYEGYKAKIAKVTKEFVKDVFPNGEYNKDSVEMKYVIQIETEPLKILDDKGNPTDQDYEYKDDKGKVKKKTVFAQLNLNKDENGNPYISKHKKAKLWAFMQKKSANKVSELVGKQVLLTAIPSKKPGDDRVFLNIVI